ncbi:CBS domain-containing protein [Thalassotalea fusca]
MSIATLMSKPLITLDMDDDLADAKKLLAENKVHHLLVLDGKKLAGVITDRDLYKHLSPTVGTHKETPRDATLLNKKVHLIMSRDLVTATVNTTLNEAVLLFHDNHVSCLPIINQEGEPIGIITWRDILRLIAIQYRQKSTAPEKA